MTVCNSDEQLNRLIDKIQPFFKKAGGIFVVTTAQWLNEEVGLSKVNSDFQTHLYNFCS